MGHYLVIGGILAGMALTGGCSWWAKGPAMALVGAMAPREANKPHRLPKACAKLGASCALPEPVNTSIDGLARKPEQKRVADTFFEVHPSFDLHVVEFDDQGYFFNRAAFNRSMACIERAAIPGSAECADLPAPGKVSRDGLDDAIIVTFVHGWEHNGKVCDSNLTCFREVLQVLAVQEQAYAQAIGRRERRVVGVYVGWRGKSLKTPGISKFDFWWRKETAHKIGSGAQVPELFARLAAVQQKAGRDRTRLVYVGHSFGAAVVYDAVMAQLAANTAAAGTAAPIAGVGDLVVLVNPAFEAARYESFHERSRRGNFTKEQGPLLLTVSSVTDGATSFFPVGRILSAPFKGALRDGQRSATVTTLGKHAPFRTHTLSAVPPIKADPPFKAADCACKSGLASLAEPIRAQMATWLEGQMDSRRRGAPAPIELAAASRYGDVRLDPVGDIDPNDPFIVALADNDVIEGHNGIFSRRFMTFLIEFVSRAEVKAYPPALGPLPRGGSR